MEILIVEDDLEAAMEIATALEGLGNILLCTVANGVMPPMNEVIERIKSAHLILLDNDFGTDYEGGDLLPHCEGKKVICTSNRVVFGQEYTNIKHFLPDPESVKILRDLVTRVIAGQQCFQLVAVSKAN